MDDIISAFEESTPSQAPRKKAPVRSPVKAEGFSKEVATYFQAYLDNRISLHSMPRNTQAAFTEGLLLSFDTARYPQLNKNLYKNIVGGLTQKTFVITQNKYAAHVDETALALLENRIATITDAEATAFTQSFAAAVTSLSLRKDMASDEFAVVSGQLLRQICASDLVLPLLLPETSKASDKPLAMRRLGEAADCFASTFAVAVSNITNAFYTGTQNTKQLQKDLGSLFAPSAITAALQTYASSLHISDAYQHVYSLHRTSQALPSRELNVYFCSILYKNESYPLFYVPVSATHTYPSVSLQFGSTISINTEALTYVTRNFTAHTGRQIVLPDLPEVIYTNDVTAGDELQNCIDELQRAFSLEGEIKILQPGLQLLTNEVVSLTNDIQFYVARQDTRANRGQYDFVLSDENAIAAYGEQLESLITTPPARYVEEIAESWQDLSSIEKLIPSGPLSTNDEQKQVLLALDKDDCDIVVVDGANGTGKSHLAAAASLQWLGKQKKVLIVAGSNEKASAITEKIAGRIQANRYKAYSPALNLSQVDNIEQIDEQAISVLKNWLDTYKERSAETAKAKKRRIQEAGETLTNLVQNAENINLQEVEQTVYNERRFAGKHWIDTEPIEEISEDIQKLHRSMQYVRSSEANYLLPYVAVNQQQAINQFIGIFREYEKTNKHVTSRLPEFIVRYRKLLPDQKDQLHSGLAYIQSNYRQFVKILKANPASQWMGVSDNTTFEQLEEHEIIQQKLITIANSAAAVLQNNESQRNFILKELSGYGSTPEEITGALNNYRDQVATLKSKLFGFSGRTLVVENLNKQLLKALPNFSIKEPEKDVELLASMSHFVQHVSEELAAGGLALTYWKDIIRILQVDQETLREATQIMQSFVAPMRYEFMAEFRMYETDNLLANIALLHYATELNRVFREQPSFGKLFGITAIGRVLARPSDFAGRITKLSGDLNEASQLDDAKQTIKHFIKKYPDASRRLGITMAAGNLEVVEDSFAMSDPEYIKEYLAHKKKEQEIRSYFDEVTTDNFSSLIRDIEEIEALEMQYELTNNAFKYLQHSKNLTSLATSIQQGQMLDDIELSDALEAFPCIAGSVTQIAQTIPLKKELFDIAIIQNAGTLSVADIVPIMLRAKKVLVIGNSIERPTDLRQNISTRLNKMYRSGIAKSVRKMFETMPADQKNVIISKVEKTFDVSESGLEFCRTYANYERTLLKQYGTMPEIADFANKYFYENSLQLLTSRARPLANVFVFDSVKPAQDEANYRTNSAEATEIIQTLLRLKENDYQGSIAIVTPYAEQAALLQKELDECVITDWFERRKLVVCTFETSSDIRRDYVFYSMVATKDRDWLSQIVPSELPSRSSDIGESARRLLRGMSVARHTMHFMLSQPVVEFTGSIRQVLEFYQSKLSTTTKNPQASTAEILLPSENDLGAAYEKTTFAGKHVDSAHFIARYQFADYLKTFSRHYKKPAYKMYFLVSYNEAPIVIEFDDLKEKFLQNDRSSKDTNGTYLSEEDVYGQKVMESYGYRFLRLNKYNLGADASAALDKHLLSVIRSSSWAKDNGLTIDQ